MFLTGPQGLKNKLRSQDDCFNESPPVSKRVPSSVATQHLCSKQKAALAELLNVQLVCSCCAEELSLRIRALVFQVSSLKTEALNKNLGYILSWLPFLICKITKVITSLKGV